MNEPNLPKPPGIFSEVGGWIAYGDDRGIWAVDPTRPGDPSDQIAELGARDAVGVVEWTDRSSSS